MDRQPLPPELVARVVLVQLLQGRLQLWTQSIRDQDQVSRLGRGSRPRRSQLFVHRPSAGAFIQVMKVVFTSAVPVTSR